MSESQTTPDPEETQDTPTPTVSIGKAAKRILDRYTHIKDVDDLEPKEDDDTDLKLQFEDDVAAFLNSNCDKEDQHFKTELNQALEHHKDDPQRAFDAVMATCRRVAITA